MLNPESADYGLCMGIAAQKAKNFDLALRAYKVATDLILQLIQAHLFSLEGYRQKEQMEQAKRALQQAQDMDSATEVESMWKDLLQEVKSILKAFA